MNCIHRIGVCEHAMPVIDSMQSMSFSSVYLDANITCIYTVDLMT